MLNLIAWFAGFCVLGYAVNAAIERWDETRCRSHWEFSLEIHRRKLATQSTSGLAAVYHRWRVRVLTARLENYWRSVRRMNQ